MSQRTSPRRRRGARDVLSIEPADDVINPERYPHAIVYHGALVLLPNGPRMDCEITEAPNGSLIAEGRVFGTRVVLS